MKVQRFNHVAIIILHRVVSKNASAIHEELNYEKNRFARGLYFTFFNASSADYYCPGL